MNRIRVQRFCERAFDQQTQPLLSAKPCGISLCLHVWSCKKEKMQSRREERKQQLSQICFSNPAFS